MSVKPLAEIGPWPRDHFSALWWLAAVYRKPRYVDETGRDVGRSTAARVTLSLYLHSLPYMVLFVLLGRLITGQFVAVEPLTFTEGLKVFSIAAAGGALYGIVGGIVFGIGGGIGVGIGGGIGVGIGEGIAGGVASAAAFAIPYYLLFLRPYYLPAHWLMVWPRARPAWYRFHPVAWDDVCRLPFRGLDRLLIAYHRIAPEKADAEINRLIDSYPSQRDQALKARVTLLARQAAVSDLTRLTDLGRQLPSGDKGFLAQTTVVRQGLETICSLQRNLGQIEVPAFRRDAARELVNEIETFYDRVGGLDVPLGPEFRAAALVWKTVAKRQLDEATDSAKTESVPQVFRAGDPVMRKLEAFVPRMDALRRLQHQVLLSAGCPGIVLFAPRRRGKSTILRNLLGWGFLPENVLAAINSMQDPKAFTSLGSFTRLLATDIRAATGQTTGDERPEDLTGLYSLLDATNHKLEAGNQRLILALDEYENIDQKIGENIFPLDLLAMVRESIQSDRNITWVFAGSHSIEQLPNASWTSYLVSARTIEVPNFSWEETSQLLTDPLRYSQLWDKDSPDRPRFQPSFWGPGGLERIHRETNGWPHLVQLVAETCVDLVNLESAETVTPDSLERALDESIVKGHTVFYELMHGEPAFVLPGEWDYLDRFRDSEEQAPPHDREISRSLKRRELVAETESGQWRLSVPLMGRWLRERG